jgi:hypothetical protein
MKKIKNMKKKFNSGSRFNSKRQRRLRGRKMLYII